MSITVCPPDPAALNRQGRTARRGLLLGLAGIAVARPALSQGTQGRPIRLVVPFPPGGGTDNTARIIVGPMSAFLGRPVVIESKPGAGGMIGAGEVARAAPDGSTILFDASSHLIVPLLAQNIPFRYETAFDPVSKVVIFPLPLVARTNAPYRDLAGLVAYARERPGSVTLGIPGSGTLAHLAGLALFQRAGIDVTIVPYRGSATAVMAVVAGEVDLALNLTTSLGFFADGRLRALAVTSGSRIPVLADVPTVAEQGYPGFDMSDWSGLWVPAGTPSAVVAQIHASVVHAFAQEAVKARMDALNIIAVGNSPAEFAADIARERQTLADLVRGSGMTIN